MGFMAGFGTSFANSFENAQTRKASKEKDAFEVAYKSAMDRQTAYESAKKEDTQIVEQARLLVGDLGLPASAVGNAADYLRAGFDTKYTMDALKQTKFSNTPSVETPEAPSTSSDPFETQTIDSGIAPPTNPVQETMNNVGSNIRNLFNPEARQQGMIDNANSEVAQAMGVGQDELNQTYTPTELPRAEVIGRNPPIDKDAPTGFDAKTELFANVDGVTVPVTAGPEGYWLSDGTLVTKSSVGAVMTQGQMDLQDKARAMIGPKVDELSAEKTITTTVGNDLAELTSMVDENGSILARASGIATLLSEINQEILAVQEYLPAEMREQEAAYQQQMAQAAQDSGAFATAEDAQLFAAKLVGVQYTFARLINGPGTLATADVENAMKALLNTNDPATFIKNANEISLTLIEKYNVKASVAMEDERVQEARRRGLDVDAMFGPIPIEDSLVEGANKVNPNTVPNEAATTETELPPGGVSVTLQEGTSQYDALVRSNPELAQHVGKKIYVTPDSRIFVDGVEI